MSAQRLGAKKLRKIQGAVGDAAVVLRGWSHGGYDFAFVTTDHHHGYYSLRTGAVEWSDERNPHYSSCPELPDYRPGAPG